MKKYLLIFILVLILLVGLAACSMGGSHDDFMQIMSARVGQKLNAFEKLRTTAPVSVRSLDNGNAEYRYRYSRTCIEVYEVDLATNVIKHFAFEGDKKHCVWM